MRGGCPRRIPRRTPRACIVSSVLCRQGLGDSNAGQTPRVQAALKPLGAVKDLPLGLLSSIERVGGLPSTPRIGGTGVGSRRARRPLRGGAAAGRLLARGPGRGRGHLEGAGGPDAVHGVAEAGSEAGRRGQARNEVPGRLHEPPVRARRVGQHAPGDGQPRAVRRGEGRDRGDRRADARRRHRRAAGVRQSETGDRGGGRGRHHAGDPAGAGEPAPADDPHADAEGEGPEPGPLTR